MNEQAGAGLRVLVPTDGSTVSNEAMPYAQSLLDPGGSLTLLTVLLDHQTYRHVAGPLGETIEDIERGIRRNTARLLSHLADSILTNNSGLEIATAIEYGDPADTIIQFASDGEFDLIVMATHGRGTMGRFAFGSVADRVARTAAVPVLLVRATGRESPLRRTEFRRILTLLDTSALSAQSIPVTRRLAAHLDLPVEVLTVVDAGTTSDPFLGVATPGTGDFYAEFMRSVHDDTSTAQAHAMEALEAGGIEAHSTVVEGPVVPAILGALLPSDLVVLTSHGRGGLRRWVLGSVAEKILRSAPTPLLLVRLPSI